MSLIGISGKIGSGKDTVGEIIRYLTYGSEEKLELICDIEDFNAFNRNHKFQIKKFADKLKNIICLLIGCTREQLEDRDFKEKELGEEWWYWKVFSNIKDDKFELIPYTGEKEFYDRKANYKGHLLKKLTPRLLLQLLGTDCGRNLIHPNIWINALMSEYKPLGINHVGIPHSENYDKGKEIYPDWIVTDMRFPNEMESIKDRKGITIRTTKLFYRYINKSNEHEWRNLEDSRISDIVRVKDTNYTKATSHKFWYETFKNKLSSEHESETALDEKDFDYVIDNTGTIEELIEKVKIILTKENIL